MGPRNIRVKGMVTSCSGFAKSLHFACSRPRTPSVEIRLGQVRVMVAGFCAPWKSTSMWRFAASRETLW